MHHPAYTNQFSLPSKQGRFGLAWLDLDLQNCRFVDIVMFVAKTKALSEKDGSLKEICRVADRLTLAFQHPPLHYTKSQQIDHCMCILYLYIFGSTMMVESIPSNSKDTPSVNSRPIHRMANARRICPCATRRTSHGDAGAFAFALRGLPPIISLWYRSRMSLTRRSRRLVTSAGDLKIRHELEPAKKESTCIPPLLLGV